MSVGRHIGKVLGATLLLLIAAVAFLAFTGTFRLGEASADSKDELVEAGAFGFSSDVTARTVETHSSLHETAESSYYERSALASPASRDIASGIAHVEEKERIEAERIAEQEATILDRIEEGIVQQSSDFAPPPPDLTEVDWSVGHDAFIAEWTKRIDAYLEGSPLEGYGSVFAEAAWENAVDPRWSPAISNTESSKGEHCFRSHNAWGWGLIDFSDWETAIRTHVEGLAKYYGYTINYAAAKKYCPPEDETYEWYVNTLAEMQSI